METVYCFININSREREFKSYYVVWKPYILYGVAILLFSLNRTM